MRNAPFLWILIVFMFLLDLYVFQGVKVITQNTGPKTRIFLHWSYWIVSFTAIIILILLLFIQFDSFHKLLRIVVVSVIISLFFAKAIAAVFFLVDDLRRGIQWMAGKLFFSGSTPEVQHSENISRSVFLSWAGTAIGGGLFGSVLYGFNNKYRYQVRRMKFAFDNLPTAFKGLKVVHISDIHSGSFNNKEAVKAGVEKIMKEKPDLIFFTGDLVNNKSEEMDDYMDVFNRLNAPLGVYSTLGNHDYGDYVQWEDTDEKGYSILKQQNLERIKQVHKDLGWRLLTNEHVLLEKGEEKIAIIGIENWSSKARFPKYGKMQKAYSGSQDIPFKILLSHDPSHWDAEVRVKYTDIDLMLSGHTHGMQFGVEIPGFKWSPVQYVYKQWMGLYEEGSQKLYINRGFGFIGYPGRVGILPEITVFELV